MLAERAVSSSKRAIYVTALAAAKGLLWVGTNVGIALTIPLPRYRDNRFYTPVLYCTFFTLL